MKKFLFSVLMFTILFSICTKENSAITRKILASFIDGSPKELFKVWHFLFEKTYTFDTQEARNRFAIFKQNLKNIKEHNAKNLSFKLGFNQFSDWTNEEFKQKMCTKKVVKGEEFDRLVNKLNAKPAKFLDDEDDLTKRNLAYDEINHIKFFGAARSQLNCGSCWAFSVTGAIEGNSAIKNNQVGSYLSPQQLVDCDTNNNGCNGGIFEPALRYAQNNGLEFESDYPYIEKKNPQCQYNQELAKTKIAGFSFCSSYSLDDEIRCSVDKVYKMLQSGPLSVGIDAGTQDFMNYESGILDTACSSDCHAVILVGYGSNNGKEYWIIRKSWSNQWGENGYVRVARNDTNNSSCFTNNEAWLPTF